MFTYSVTRRAKTVQQPHGGYLPLSAGLAVRGGLKREDALQMITKVPAEICGIADRVGSLKVGKDADLVIYRGDPLDIYFQPERVFVNGRPVQR